MKSPNLINLKKLITLTFIFVVATLALLILSLIPLPASGLTGKLRMGLFYTGFFGYGFAILSFLGHYIEKVNNWLKKYKRFLIIIIASVIALIHALLMGFKEGTLLSFFAYLTGDALLIIGLQTVHNFFGKNKSGNKKRVRKSEDGTK